MRTGYMFDVSEIILDSLEMIDDRYLMDAKEHPDRNEVCQPPKVLRIRRTLAIAAVIAVLLTLCGFAAYELGWFDPWFQRPSVSPVAVVQSAVEHQIDKEYTIAVLVEDIKIDEEETRRLLEMYSGSELAEARGWTDEYLAEHFIVVWASYYVEYNHEKTFLDDGRMEQYFYLTRNEESGEWTITDNSSPNPLPVSFPTIFYN